MFLKKGDYCSMMLQGLDIPFAEGFYPYAILP